MAEKYFDKCLTLKNRQINYQAFYLVLQIIIYERYMRKETNECKFIIENKNELKKDIKTLEEAWDKIKNY